MVDNVQFDVTVRDRFSRSMNKLRGTVNTAKRSFGNLEQSSKRMAAAFAAARQKTESLRSSLQGVANASRTAALASAAFVTGSIFLADKQIKAENQLSLILRAQGETREGLQKQLLDQASALQQISRFGDEDIIANITVPLLQAGLSPDSPIFQQAQQLALDIAAAGDRGLDQVGENLGEVLGAGDLGPLKELNKTILSGFTDAQKVQFRRLDTEEKIQFILKERGALLRDQAKTEAQGAGTFIQLANILGDIVEKIGSVDIALLQPLVEGAKVVASFVASQPLLTGFIAVVGLLVAIISSAIFIFSQLGLAVLAANAFMPILASSSIAATLGLTGLSSAALVLRVALLALQTIGIVGLILTIIGVIVLAVRNFDFLKETALSVFSSIGDAIISSIDTVRNFIRALVEGIAAVGELFIKFSAFGALIFIFQNLETIIASITDFFRGAGIAELLNKAFDFGLASLGFEVNSARQDTLKIEISGKVDGAESEIKASRSTKELSTGLNTAEVPA